MRLKGIFGGSEVLQSFIVYVLFPIIVILLIIGIVVIVLNQYGFNISLPNLNPFK